jgi:hypothetical protein
MLRPLRLILQKTYSSWHLPMPGACALANKLARRLWAMEHHGKPFDAHHVSRQPLAA